MKSFVIITRSKKCRRITQHDGKAWVQDWIDDGWSVERSISWKHSENLKYAALQLYARTA